jgi:hypothetical protein
MDEIVATSTLPSPLRSPTATRVQPTAGPNQIVSYVPPRRLTAYGAPPLQEIMSRRPSPSMSPVATFAPFIPETEPCRKTGTSRTSSAAGTDTASAAQSASAQVRIR